MPEQDFCLESVATFNRMADRYAAKYFHLDIYNKYLERFHKRIGARGANVLDVACGPGNVSAYLAKARPDLQIMGIDLAEEMVKQARHRVPTGEFMVRDCRCIGDLGRSFEASAFAFGLSYLTDSDADRFFSSLNATLSLSAMLYLSTITGEPAQSGFDTSSTGDRVYIRYRTVEDVVSLVKLAGFKVESLDVIASPPNATTSTEDIVLVARRTGNVSRHV